MNPLIMERDEETNEPTQVINVVEVNEVTINEVSVKDSMTEITLSERSRLSESETNRMDWLSILWQTAVLTVTGVAVCLVFNYIS
jgi:hypothetical protein